jgi:hypothetical protein
VGFVYSKMGPAEAAADLLHRVHENCRDILAEGRDAMVPIILDGENAWEYYDQSGRPFLRELYRLISNDSRIAALTMSEALERMDPEPIGHIFPGSWINANFDIWIGAAEDNQAWECLLRARQTYDRVLASPEGAAISEERRRLAFEELLIAEGSDWCWWYGPEHSSDNRPEFDRLFRDHLANVYRSSITIPRAARSGPRSMARRLPFSSGWGQGWSAWTAAPARCTAALRSFRNFTTAVMGRTSICGLILKPAWKVLGPACRCVSSLELPRCGSGWSRDARRSSGTPARAWWQPTASAWK